MAPATTAADFVIKGASAPQKLMCRLTNNTLVARIQFDVSRNNTRVVRSKNSLPRGKSRGEGCYIPEVLKNDARYRKNRPRKAISSARRAREQNSPRLLPRGVCKKRVTLSADVRVLIKKFPLIEKIPARRARKNFSARRAREQNSPRQKPRGRGAEVRRSV